MHEKYLGQEQLHNTQNGSGIMRTHFGQSVIKTTYRIILLNDVLHVENASENLLSVHRITLANGVFIEFHPFSFLSRMRQRRRFFTTVDMHAWSRSVDSQVLQIQ